MNKKLFCLFICIICLGMVGCSKINSRKMSNDVKSNEIVLKTNGGVPYNWEYEIGDTAILIFDNLNSIELDKNVEGGRVEQHYTFRGLKPGNTTIKFVYRNFVDKRVDSTKEYDVTVDDDLNVVIKEKSE